MLVKFQNQSNRVKGLAFHPQRPWVLASLHNGAIQLWDYRMETLIEKFEEHDGPVRGVHFHRSQPLFVSGGDDYKIKVWNYQQKRCLFNLLGHLDYIRTVQFHHEHPWILSASDDQTIRIWNWQSRQCLSVLTGHNHYVMCAQFHPKEDLILSASLDQSVRVWDIAGFRKKTVSIQAEFNQPQNQASSELFGGSDIVVKHVLEGHSRGVNWAAFHKTAPLIVSGADDREVKLWRMNEVKAWEVDTMRGHVNNVSCVLFHPKRELVVSNSEDKSIRVWDITKTNPPLTFRRDADRYWILDAHPTLNLLAAGHDSGLIVFKLDRERPPFDAQKKEVFYFKDSFLRRFEFQSGKDQPIVSTPGRRPNSELPKFLHYNNSNKSQHCMLLVSESADQNSTYELFVMPKAATVREDQVQSFKGAGKCAVFVSRNRFAVLDKSKSLWLKDLKNEVKRKVAVPNLVINHVFSGGVGRLLFRTPDAMVLYDMQVFKVIGKLQITSRHPIKYVVWSPYHKYVAMFSKANIYIANNNLDELCQINENSRIKSGAWDPLGVFVYSTSTHIKYLLPNGDSGIIRTIENPIYITGVSSTTLHFLDREVKTGTLGIDTTEYQFKVALIKRRHKDVLRIMKSNKLVGHSTIAYLEKKGYPEVALHFVQDPKTKFSLALECGNIRVALDCAQELDTPECWHKLGVEALRQGNHQVVEAAYQKTKNFERLSFLYLITGNVEKLSKMLQIATYRNDIMGRFHNALYLGNVEDRIAVLKQAGHPILAYLTACAHGLEEEAAAIAAELGEHLPTNLPDVSNAALLFPPNPILHESNWPLLDIAKGYFDQAPGEEGPSEEELRDSDEEAAGMDDDEDARLRPETTGATDTWLEDDGDKPKKSAAAVAAEAPAKSGWGGGLLDDLGVDLNEEDKFEDVAPTNVADEDGFVMPQNGRSVRDKWGENSSLAADQAAAGAFDVAMHSLTRQIGVANFGPLRDGFLQLYNSSRILLPGLPGGSALVSHLQRTEGLPLTVFTHAQCVEELKMGLKAFGEERLEDAVNHFRHVLHTVPLVVCEKKAEENEVKSLVAVCKEYITALRLELGRRASTDPVRQCALGAYFTRCKLQPLHVVLGLKVAIKSALQLKNFKLTGLLARRLLELCTTSAKAANLAQAVDVNQIKGVLKLCEKNGNADAVEIDYKENIAMDICAETFTPIPKGREPAKCPYCLSTYQPELNEQICRTCDISRIGAETTGLQCYQEPKASNAAPASNAGSSFSVEDF